MEKIKTVFHINEKTKWSDLLNNVFNYLNYDSKAEIKILVNGNAVKGLKKEFHEEERIHEVVGLGVKIYACENSMRSNKLDKEDLMKGINITPVGVAFLGEIQNKGYGYIKP